MHGGVGRGKGVLRHDWVAKGDECKITSYMKKRTVCLCVSATVGVQRSGGKGGQTV